MHTRKRTKHASSLKGVDINRTPARDRPGALGWREFVPEKLGNAGGGSDLGQDADEYVVKDMEIGQPINPKSVQKRRMALHESKVR